MKLYGMRLGKIYIAMVFILSLVLAGPDIHCYGKSKKKAGVESAISPMPTDYEKLFEGKKCVSEKGLLTLHDVEGSLLVEIPLSLMDRDFLIGSTISGITDNRLVSVGEKPRPPMLVTFLTEGEKLNIVKRKWWNAMVLIK